MKIAPYYLRQRCDSMTPISRNIWFMRILSGVPWRWGIKRKWGSQKTSIFNAFVGTIFGTLGNKANIIILLFSPLLPFHKYVTLTDLERPFYVKFCLLGEL